MFRTTPLLVSLLLGFLTCCAAFIDACPFCSVTSQTLSEEIDSADAVVLARLVKPGLSSKPAADAVGGFGIVDPDTGMATFEIFDVIKGADRLTGLETVEVVFFGPPETEKSFLITGIGTDTIEWTTPLPLTERAVQYARKLPNMTPSGPDRLEFFQDYLQDEDPLLAQDAYDEFARAPYDEVKALADRMDHDRLVSWITDPDVSPSQRRLYLTMLGVCGDEHDLPMLEDLILSDFRNKEPILNGLVQAGLTLGGPVTLPLVSEVVEMDERRKKLGLDALIACYLKLRGPDGLAVIEDRFLRDHSVDYTQTYQTLMALRFHGEETDEIPRERLLASVRLLLDHPDFADQVIPDLARWEDWEILDRLVQMFKDADERSFVKQPIVTYLVVAGEQEGEIGERATAALTELEELDAEAVKRARGLMAFGFLGRSRPQGDAENYTRDGSPFTETADNVNDDAVDDEDFAGEADGQGDALQTGADEIPDPADPRFAATSQLAASEKADDETQNDSREEAESPQKPAADQEFKQAGADLKAPDTALIVGVPLIATALLTGLFWLILRSGGA